jgi:hypothetical protein
VIRGDRADDDESRLVFRASGKLDPVLVKPEGLGFDEVDPVLRLVGVAFPLIELELQKDLWIRNGI